MRFFCLEGFCRFVGAGVLVEVGLGVWVNFNGGYKLFTIHT